MICKHCGYELNGKEKFCPKCGKPLKSRRKFIIGIGTGAVALIAVLVIYVSMTLYNSDEATAERNSHNAGEYYALVKCEGKYGYINERGEEIIPCQYEDADSFNKNGLAAVSVLRDGREQWGFINKSGEEVIPLDYDQVVTSTENDLVAVGRLSDRNDENSEMNWGFFNSEGHAVTGMKYQFEKKPDLSHENGIVVVSEKAADESGTSYLYGVINEKGETLLEPENHIIISDETLGTGGMIAVKDKGSFGENKFGFLDIEGDTVVRFDYEDGQNFSSNGLAAVQKDGKWGYIDSAGDIVIPCQYRAVGTFNDNGIAVVYDDESAYCKFIDENGNTVIDEKYFASEGFDTNGMAIVSAAVDPDGVAVAWGIIDTEGKEVVPCEYDWIIRNTNGTFAAVKGEQIEVADTNGRLVDISGYDTYSVFGDNGWTAAGTLSGQDAEGEDIYQWSFISWDGEIQLELPVEYSEVGAFRNA